MTQNKLTKEEREEAIDLFMEDDDIMPDMPNVLMALEAKMEEYNEMEDLGKITKRELAINQEILLDSLIDLSRFAVLTKYKLDILDRAVEGTTTEELTEEEKKAADETTNKKKKKKKGKLGEPDIYA